MIGSYVHPATNLQENVSKWVSQCVKEISFPDAYSVAALHTPRAWKLTLANTITLSAVIVMALNLERLR
jgi:hypothetical protein